MTMSFEVGSCKWSLWQWQERGQTLFARENECVFDLHINGTQNGVAQEPAKCFNFSRFPTPASIYYAVEAASPDLRLTFCLLFGLINPPCAVGYWDDLRCWLIRFFFPLFFFPFFLEKKWGNCTRKGQEETSNKNKQEACGGVVCLQRAVMISNTLAFNILIDNFLINPSLRIAHLPSDLLDLRTLGAVCGGEMAYSSECKTSNHWVYVLFPGLRIHTWPYIWQTSMWRAEVFSRIVGAFH